MDLSEIIRWKLFPFYDNFPTDTKKASKQAIIIFILIKLLAILTYRYFTPENQDKYPKSPPKSETIHLILSS